MYWSRVSFVRVTEQIPGHGLETCFPTSLLIIGPNSSYKYLVISPLFTKYIWYSILPINFHFRILKMKPYSVMFLYLMTVLYFSFLFITHPSSSSSASTLLTGRQARKNLHAEKFDICDSVINAGCRNRMAES